MRRNLQLGVIGFVGLTTLAAVDGYFRHEAAEDAAQRLTASLSRVAEQLHKEVQDRIRAIESLAGFLQAAPTMPGFDRFDEFAKVLLRGDRTIRGVQFVDRQRVIRHSYPRRGNEAAIGLDLMTRPAAPFVSAAIRERRTTVNHPVRTVQGSLSIVARTPFYRDGRLAGLAQGVIDISPLVNEATGSVDRDIGFILQDAEGRRFFGETALHEPTASVTVAVGDNSWKLIAGWKTGPPGPPAQVLVLLWVVGGALWLSLLMLANRVLAREENLQAAVIERTRDLSESEERFRALSEASPDGVFIVDNGRIVDVNAAGAALLGLDVESTIDREVSEFVQPEAWPAIRERMQRGDEQPFELSVRRVDGELIPVKLRPRNAVYRGRRVRISSMRDLREQQSAEWALRDSEARLIEAQRIARLGSWELDLASNRLTWSDEIFRIFEIDPSRFDASYEAFLTAVHPEDRERVRQTFDASVRNRTQYEITHRLVMPNGRIKHVHERGRTYYDDGGRPLRSLGTVQDLTEQVATEQRQRALLEAVPDLMFRIRADGTFLDFKPSPLIPTLLPPEEFLGRRMADVLPPTAAKALMEANGRALTTGKLQTHTYQLTVDGIVRDYEARIVPSGPDEVISMVRDITDMRQTEARMRKLSGAVEQTADAVMITDRGGVIEYVNQAFEHTTGFARTEAIGQTPRLVRSGRQDKSFYAAMWQTILAGGIFSDVFINRRKDGELYYEEKTITPLKDEQGEITHFISTGKDVSERMQAQDRLQFMAQHDALTELPNRSLLLDRLKQSLARARWHNRLVAVLFLDLDRFKTINDTLGHEAGDQVLQQLSQRFSLIVREGDTVARFGGDEFVILLDDVASSNDVGMVAQKVLDALAKPFSVEQHSLYITASIGISLFPSDAEESGTLLRYADTAMYRAKEAGKNTYQFYSADMSARAFERLSLETSLRHALERKEFVLHYQPQLDVDSGQIIGVEALIRWQHPDFGLVAPAEFVPLLEETGLIVAVGEWVLQTACAQLREWHEAGRRDLRLAVNLSPRQVLIPGLVDMAGNAMNDLRGSPGRLELEITEGVLVQHSPTTLETLEALRRLGIRLAVDDFGTGYSSLSYLRRFPIDTLKIDRSFVRDIPQDPDDSAITTAIIAMAQSLRLEVIAEGVENLAQRDYLRSRGCCLMQGYLFSKPLPVAEITPLLMRGRLEAASG